MDELTFFFEILNQTKSKYDHVPHYETMDASGLPIFPAGSSITTEEFKIKFDEVLKEYPLNTLREQRNILLKESDWVMVSDYNPPNKDEWVAYRQVLRDLPQTQQNITTDVAGNLIGVVFPEKP